MTYEETVTLDKRIKEKVEFIRVGEERRGEVRRGEERRGSNGIR